MEARNLIEVKSDINVIALSNDGDILLGKGNDQIRLTGGRLDGSGVIKFGNGRDEMIGFGNQSLVHGGKGRDVLRLEPGTYSLKRSGKRYQLSDKDASMMVKGFERLGALESEASEIARLQRPSGRCDDSGDVNGFDSSVIQTFDQASSHLALPSSRSINSCSFALVARTSAGSGMVLSSATTA